MCRIYDEVAEKLKLQYNMAQYTTENMENVYFKCYYGCNLDGSDIDARMAQKGMLNNINLPPLMHHSRKTIDYRL